MIKRLKEAFANDEWRNKENGENGGGKKMFASMFI